MRLTEWFRRRGVRGRTVHLPATGRALVVSDLHGHWGDFEAFLAATQAFERIEAGEDLWVIFTGDVPDVVRHQSVDSSVPDDGDVRILEDLIAWKRRLGPERGRRIVYLEGNHDFHVSRIWREVARYHAYARGEAPPTPEKVPRVSEEELSAYARYYRESYGDAVYENNIGPYDMVRRCRPELVEFLESSPILAVLEGCGVLVTHAGPPRRGSWSGKELRKSIDRADREDLRRASPEAYYENPYHQLLNNRFRNGDYTLDDLDAFLNTYGASLLVTGHTPHPYLVDFEARAPLPNCAFRDGLGTIGARQVVLCSSFGALHPAWKRYLDLELGRRYDTLEDLFAGGSVRALRRADDPALREARALPGADFILGEALESGAAE
ncbi:MAG: hypothetical protein D6731_25980 [Planctomycetota bacterium]|nr:MAG: hypothetical protein D6731_25980 [Planctomycetota bacterium]